MRKSDQYELVLEVLTREFDKIGATDAGVVAEFYESIHGLLQGVICTIDGKSYIIYDLVLKQGGGKWQVDYQTEKGDWDMRECASMAGAMAFVSQQFKKS